MAATTHGRKHLGGIIMSPAAELLFVVACVGAGLGAAGLIVLVRGGSLIRQRRRSRRGRRSLTVSGTRLLVAGAAGIAAWVVTGWPHAALAAAAIVVLWPQMFGAATAGKAEIAKLAAIATWTETLRDLTAAGASLEQAIPRSAATSTTVLKPTLQRLADQLEVRVPLARALDDMSRDVNDAACDEVMAALKMNAQVRAAKLGEILGDLAQGLRAEVEMRRQEEAKRRNLRREVRIMVIAVFGYIGLQLLVAPDHLAPFGRGVGRLVFIAAIGLFIYSFIRARRLAEPDRPEPFLATEGVA